MDYDRAFEMVIGHEGDFTDNPKDRGNWTSGKIGIGTLNGTKYGISAMSYPEIDIQNMTLDQAKAIYKRDYWDRCQCDQLPAVLRFHVFDAAVNSGVKRAATWLQHAVNLNPSGIIDAKTIMAARWSDPLSSVTRFNGERLQFMTDLPTWKTFGRGWARRIAENLKSCNG